MGKKLLFPAGVLAALVLCGAGGEKPSPASKETVQEALQVTWVLKGHLKNAQIAYLRVGALLVKVRDQKLYEALHHPDMESYAAERLHLGRGSLYRYLQVYDWVSANHKEWLDPKPKGFIPDLADVADLIWIEKQLAKPDLDAKARAELEKLREKGLSGDLRERDLREWRKKGRTDEDALKAFLSKLRLLQKEGADLKDMPPEVISDLEDAIEKLSDAIDLQKAGSEAESGGK